MFLLLVSKCLLENEPLGSGNTPQLETTNKSKRINNPQISLNQRIKKPQTTKPMSFESILKLAGV